MHDPFIIPFKTANSSTNESLMPVIEYLYPSYSALSTATLQNLPDYENSQLTVTVRGGWTHLRTCTELRVTYG